MAKPENKTRPTEVSPGAFIAGLEDGPRKADAERLLAWFGMVTGLEGRMWGSSIVGFGRYHYRYDSGREGDAAMTAFSPRKAELVVYVPMGYASDAMAERLSRLGKHRIGKSCLYVKRLTDIDLDVLAEIVTAGMIHLRATYPTFET